MKVGHYFIETAGGAEAQAHALDRFHFSCGNLKRHDPHDVVQKHCTTCKFHYPYTHDAWPDEETFRRAQTLYELIFRMRGSARERKEAAKARQAKEEQEAKIRAEQEARMKAAVDKRHSELKREKRNDKGKDQMDPENEEAAAARLTEIEKIRQEERNESGRRGRPGKGRSDPQNEARGRSTLPDRNDQEEDRGGDYEKAHYGATPKRTSAEGR